ncbi:MAG: hypothetical protein HYV08_07410 [Deltaproteobacteria bacterium]|nr:hypothetical protein [Deltaproteobacteria bacterium]MBI3075848.1 hypothetical protein [Deltaproteobacteria bacterium]
MKRVVLFIGTALWLVAATAEARVTRIEISRREAFAGGQALGNVGPYEKLVGRFHGELDPAHPLNAGIVDLDRAPRNARGRVEYAADLYLLKPVDLARGNGALFYDVNNRGNKNLLRLFNSALRSNDPTTAADAGNGFLMRQGFTVVWSGWIAGLSATNHNLRIEVPVASGPSGPIEQVVWDEFLFNTRAARQARLSFRATSTDPRQATLLVRDRNTGAPTAIPPGQWEFVDPQSIRLLPAGTAFRMGAIYQLIYRTANPPVAGIGFAATRDLISFLRYQAADDVGTANPLAVGGRPAVQRTLAHGSSQSGRYLRDFVYRGFNEDEANRIVFDGINPHISAARLFLNHRFAQPNRAFHTAHGFMFFPDVTFPSAYETQTDPLTGKTDGIFARCANRGNCPKVIHTVSSTEYWQAGQSLVTTDPLGRRDGTLPDTVRIYLVSSTQHLEFPTMPKGVCALPPNPTDLRPVLRALALALDRWVKDGTPPPPSQYPRIADGTLVRGEALGFPRIPGLTLPSGPNPRLRFDYGPEYEKGIIGRVLPEVLLERYEVLVPKVDADGNEVGGIGLPDIAAPTGTATGWAVRAADAGGAGELCYLDGSFAPFAKTKAEREARGDPRPSIEERYRDKADYVARVRQAAVTLERAGYLLPEDVQRSVDRANAVPW